MLTAARLTAFAATTQPDLARAFYGETLGLRLITEDDFALLFDANGTDLRVQKVRTVQPSGYTALGWQVPDIRATVVGLRELGVAFERYPYFEQDTDGIWDAPGGARVAWFKDPDGNLLSVVTVPTS